jgi:hypothetical protein
MEATLIRQKTANWLAQSFFKEAVVLAVDIGIEGIGLCLRKGPDILVNKTLVFDLPQAEALKDRRAKRAWRHCRKNRKTRMNRLRKLFAKHDLPWPTLDVLSRTDPFVLRHRAITSLLASPIALAIAIRHLVLRRGYDFHASSEGEFPWGEDPSLAEARKWLETSHINEEIADYLWQIEPELTTKASASGKELTGAALAKEEAERDAFRQDVRKRLAVCETLDIGSQLEKYRRSNDPRLRSAMRRQNLPRRMLEEHLRNIISRHQHHITGVEEFTAALFLKPDRSATPLLQKRAKEKAVFHFNRKTRAEAEAIWLRKTKGCTLAPRLGLPAGKAGDAKNDDIRRWRILEFAATRRVEIVTTTGRAAAKTERISTVRLPASTVQALMASVANKASKWSEVKKLIADGVSAADASAKISPGTRSPFNKSYFTQLQDLILPTAANGRKKANVSPVTAAHLVQVATAGDTDFSPQGINDRLNAIDFYNLRRLGASSGPLHPQIRFLLGQRATKEAGEPLWAVDGKLQRLFASDKVASALEGQTSPDYLIIECVGDAPRNQAQKREIELEQKTRRTDRDALFEGHSIEDSGVASRRRRIVLHDQQRGRCPFTGLQLGNPLSPDLELEHLFPQSRGGLSTDGNLVLTFRWVNSLKDKYTPCEFAGHRTDARILEWEAMVAATRDFKWSARKVMTQPHRKRDLFEFEGDAFPDFGNTTFTAQLARQLVHEAAIWMGVKDDPEEIRKRIATPSGWLAAQARRTWIVDETGTPMRKNRDEPQHHLVDALVLAHIPPADGMNSVACGGIFWSEWQTVEHQGVRSRRAVTRALPGLLPPSVIEAHLRPLLGSDPVELPVEKHRARRKWASSLGDSTFWRVDTKTGTTYQREPLKRSKKKYPDAEALAATLRMTRIPKELMPSTHDLERWIELDENDTTELKLKDGTPVRNVWKSNSKGSLAAPLGWTAEPAIADNDPKRFLSLSVGAEALEIWVGWNGKKWVFIKRRKPERTALRHLRRFAGPLNAIAPEWMQDKPDKPETHKTLEQIVCGNVLPPGARKLPKLSFRKGDHFRVSFTQEGKIRPYHESLPSTWVEVSALKGDCTIDLKPLLALPEVVTKYKPNLGAVADLLPIAGHFADAAATAAALGLAAPPHDPSPHPGGRSRAGNPRPSGQADLWQA